MDGETQLAAAFDMQGAFNQVALSLEPDARLEEVIERLDLVLDSYGGRGAYGRKDQFSHRYLSEEFRQLQQMAGMLPVIFLGVAAFLLNVVITRLVSTEREEIATLKAFGYSNIAVGTHYLKFVLLIVFLGSAAGTALGLVMGREMSELYMEYYRFPYLDYRLPLGTAVTAFAITAAAAVAGTVRAVWRAVELAPAQAMRPEAPARYRPTVLERLGFQRLLSPPARMILRDFERRPLKAFVSIFGISLACGILVLGTFFLDAIDYTVQVEFGRARQEDMAVTFVGPVGSQALHDAVALPGVRYAEPTRVAPVILRRGHRTYRTQVEGLRADARLHRILDAERRPVTLPAEGVLLTDYLADFLEIRPGESLTVEILEGERRTVDVPLAGVTSQILGVGAYMELGALNRLLGEGPVITGAYLATEPDGSLAARAALRDIPKVAGVQDMRETIEDFYESMGRQVSIFVLFASLFAAAIAFGVVYNNARISLSERSREMASLRVLGLTRGETSYILLGELALLILVGIPLGMVVGWGLSAILNDSFQTDLFRIPLVIERGTYATAAAVVLGSAVFSALVVRRHVDRLDMVAVLKTRE